MTPERWRRVTAVFHAAREREAVERAAFLDQACAADEALRAEVEALLSAHERAGGDFGVSLLETLEQRRLEPGTMLGRYRLERLIGAGGMGEVYRARHVKLGREAAIKVLPGSLASDPGRLRRLEREARAASALNHPAIVTIYDIDEHEGRSYIAMELVDGAPLREHLQSGPLAVREVVRLAVAIAEGLARAHEGGIVHRDLKPENVMITREGGPKILDFGLAKRSAAAAQDGDEPGATVTSTERGVVLGTVPYMSPEQAAGGTVDHRSDQFSFGVMLYEMLCGRRPFKGDSTAALLGAILRDTPPPLRSLRPDTPRELADVVDRCLSKVPDERYASTRELRDALVRCHERLHATSRLPRLPRRTAAAALAVVAAAIGAMAWLAFRDGLVRWRERDTFGEIDRLTDAGELFDAFRLARRLQDRLPDDPEVRKRIDRITLPIAIVTEPPGAEVEVKGYASAPEAPWVRLGVTPLSGVRVPYALTHWKITKPGFAAFEGAPFGGRPFQAIAKGLVLDPEGSHPGMVRVPGGPYARLGFPPVQLADYWIDRYEVSNRQFKDFVDAGGYGGDDYWNDPVVENGRRLSRPQVLARLVDATGRTGPAGWELGAYPEGKADHPVGGVSWYEAAAYCRSVGKTLPTVFHWSAATAQDQLSDVVRVSNFGKNGPAPVGSHPGLGDFGTYDMAGNVREWTWNESATGRFILGGSWADPTYMFRVNADAWPPLSREPGHGFRCAAYGGPLDETLLAPLTPEYAASGTQPVNDQVFAAYRSMFAYDRKALDAAVESADESSPHWRRETVSFAAAYGDERVRAHLFLPRNARPPYQAVIWFPGNDVFFLPAGEALASPYLFDFIPRGGRALVYPVYKGTYERRVPFSFAPNEWRDLIVLWSKDLSRTVDYLEGRPDIDASRLGYYGFSSGAIYGPIFTAVDERFKASVLLAGGLFGGFLPEVSVVNFAPRSRVPTLMINGRDDFITGVEVAQKPLFRLLAAPESDKRHAQLEGGHIPRDRIGLIDEVLRWFDRYLGPVQGHLGPTGT